MAMLEEKEVRRLKETTMYALNETDPNNLVNRGLLQGAISAYKKVLKE